MRCIAMPVKQRVRLLITQKNVKYVLTGRCCAKRNKATGKKLCVDNNIRRGAEEIASVEVAETVDASEDFVEDDGQTGPISLRRSGDGRRRRVFRINEVWVRSDDFDEGVLKQRVTK